MPRESIKIAVECRDIHPAVDYALTSVHHRNGSDRVRSIDYRSQIWFGSERIGCLRNGYHPCTLIEKRREKFRFQPSRIVDWQNPYLRPFAFCGELPRNYVGVMFYFADYYIVALMQELFAPRIRNEIYRSRSTRRKYHLLAAACADERPYAFTGILVQRRHAFGQMMHSAVDIGIEFGMQTIHRIDDALRLLGSRTAVEIDQRLAVYPTRKYREIFPYLIYIESNRFYNYSSLAAISSANISANASTSHRLATSFTKPSVCKHRASFSLNPR